MAIFPKWLTHGFGRKMAIFSKGLTHGLCSKMAIFPTLFLRNIGQENVFYDILERKIASHRLPMVLVQKWPFFDGFGS